MPLYNPPQPLDSDLTAIAALSTTAAGLALLDDADASAQRTTLGLGTAALKNTGQSGDAVPICNGGAITVGSGATNYATIGSNGINVTAPGAAKLALSGDEILTRNGGTGQIDMISAANIVMTPSGGTVEVVGAMRCDSFRIDQAAAADVVVQSHTVTVSLNGTDYKLMCVAA